MSDVHPDAKDLAEFAAGRLPPRKAARIASHLNSCPTCQKHLPRRSPGGTVIPSGKTSPNQPSTGEKPPPELASSTKYEILGKIGEGGMGAVWKARQNWLGRAVAIKVLSGEALSHPEAHDRFRLEMLAGGRLDHPNVVKTYDAEQVGDALLLVMEYVEGISLDRLVKQKGALPITFACRCALQVAEGLQYAHEKGLVHRDIKPANLMVTREKQIKVLDFGLARLASTHDGERKTNFQTFMGTADYVSPEQAVNAREADIRSDVYSLGCTLYFLLTGKPPFEGGSTYEIAAAQLTDAPSPIPDLPPGLWCVIAKMMAKKPLDRFQTPAEVVEALQPFTTRQDSTASLSATALPALPALPAKPPSRFRRRHAVVLGAGMVMLPIVTTTVLYFRSDKDPIDTPSPLVSALEPSTPNKSNDPLPPTKTEPLPPTTIVSTKSPTTAAPSTKQQEPAHSPTLPEKKDPPASPPSTKKNDEPKSVVTPKKMDTLPAPIKNPPNKESIQKESFRIVKDAIVLSQLEEHVHALLPMPGKPELLAVHLGVTRPKSEFWDWNRRKLLGTFPPRKLSGTLSGVILSPSGKLFATWSGRPRQPETWEAIITHAGSGAEALRIPLRTSSISRLSFTTDETRLWGWQDHLPEVRVWSLTTGKELPARKPEDPPPANVLPSYPKTISPTGRFVAMGFSDGQVRVWDIESGKTVKQFRATTGSRITLLVFSPDEKRLLTRGSQETARIWDWESQLQILRIPGEAKYCSRMVFSPEGNRLFVGGVAGWIDLWDLSSGRRIRRFASNQDDLMALAISDDGQTLFSAGMDRKIRIWNVSR